MFTPREVLTQRLIASLRVSTPLYHQTTTDHIGYRAQHGSLAGYNQDDYRFFTAFAILEHQLRSASRLPN